MINKCDGFSSRGLGCGCEAGTIDISEDWDILGIDWYCFGYLPETCSAPVACSGNKKK